MLRSGPESGQAGVGHNDYAAQDLKGRAKLKSGMQCCEAARSRAKLKSNIVSRSGPLNHVQISKRVCNIRVLNKRENQGGALNIGGYQGGETMGGAKQGCIYTCGGYSNQLRVLVNWARLLF